MIIANWKCNGSKAMIDDWFNSFRKTLQNKGVDAGIIGIAPPSIFLNELDLHIKKYDIDIDLCSQDISGSVRRCTGAISSDMLKENNAFGYCIVGHSDRRALYKEDNEIIQDKVFECLSSDINPIICIGESEEENNLGKTEEILKEQLSILRNVSLSDSTTIAYEPIWAIGTGKTPDPKDVNEIHKFIKDVVQSISANTLVPLVLYGGSVSKENAESFLKEEYVDGALIGGASLDGKNFAEIINTMRNIKC